MKKRRKRKLCIRGAAILILLLAIAIILTHTTPMFNISIIWVEGNSRITNEQIIEASGIKTGQNIWRIHKSKAIKSVEAIPYIESAKIIRGLPKSIKIQVTENEIKAYLEIDKGYAALSKTGEILEIMRPDIAVDKPVIKTQGAQGTEVGKNISFENKEFENVFYTCFQKLDEYGVLNNIKQLDINSTIDVSFTTKAGMLVKLGGQDEIDYKMQYFNRILEELGEDAGGMLDLTNTDKVPYRENIE